MFNLMSKHFRIFPVWLRYSLMFVLALLAALQPELSNADTTPAASDELPHIAVEGLPAQGKDWLTQNPYRGMTRAIEPGKQAYHQACARCHGADAIAQGRAPAPDLRRLDAYCKKVTVPEQHQRCLADNDRYFVTSVRQGKVRVGIVHMPAWEKHLSQETVWAIRTYLESRSRERQ
jgi:cytochrome c-550 PedF